MCVCVCARLCVRARVCTHVRREPPGTPQGVMSRTRTGLQKVPLPSARREGLASLGLRSQPSCHSQVALRCFPPKRKKPDLKGTGRFQGASWFQSEVQGHSRKDPSPNQTRDPCHSPSQESVSTPGSRKMGPLMRRKGDQSINRSINHCRVRKDLKDLERIRLSQLHLGVQSEGAKWGHPGAPRKLL